METYRQFPITVAKSPQYNILSLLDSGEKACEYPYCFQLIPAYFSRNLCFEISSLLHIQLKYVPHTEAERVDYLNLTSRTASSNKQKIDDILSGFPDYLLHFSILFSTSVELLLPSVQRNLPHCLQSEYTDFYPEQALIVLEELFAFPRVSFFTDADQKKQIAQHGSGGERICKGSASGQYTDAGQPDKKRHKGKAQGGN